MTEEKQKYIDAISTKMRSIAEEHDENLQFEYDVLKLALAALTAPPVKLPDIEENEPAFNAGLNALIDCLEDCGDAEQGLRLALRAIRAAGYEVQE